MSIKEFEHVFVPNVSVPCVHLTCVDRLLWPVWFVTIQMSTRSSRWFSGEPLSIQQKLQVLFSRTETTVNKVTPCSDIISIPLLDLEAWRE